jgi:hypothetical protein
MKSPLLPRPSIGGNVPLQILIWIALVLAIVVVVGVLRLPERMQCGGGGRHMSCRYGVLSPEAWSKPSGR